MDTITTKSLLFTEYNRMKTQACREGIDAGRINRALGVAQRKEPRPYVTTLISCTCPDWLYRGRTKRQPCKHMIALRLKKQTEQKKAEAREAEILKELGF